MAYPEWIFTVSNRSGAKLGELTDVTDRTVTLGLSSPATAGFKVPVTSNRLTELLTQDLNLLCYRNRRLMFHGPIITAQLAADDPTATPTVVCTAADPSWRFDRRVSGKSASGYTPPGATDRLTIAETLISTANGETNGETGVQTLGQTCGSTAVYTAGPYKKLSECIADLGNTLNGFDWYINPIEYASGKIGQFVAAALIGITRTGTVFEYQGRGNARAPNYVRGIDTSANKVYSIPDDGPTSALGVLTSESTDEQAKRGLLEEVVDTSSITNTALRQAVLDDHILYRKLPRQVLSFQPDFDDGGGRVPQYGIDYAIGDLVRARVLYNGAVLVDGFVRLYKMQFDIDENNRETLTPTVVAET